MPLKAYQSMNAYKLFMMDVGLLGALSELPAEAILEGNDIFVEFKGALTEQYVLQQMISDTPYTPYYYGTDKGTFEQDFLIQKERNIVPIEVKAEGNLRSQSLKAYCEKFHPNMAVRLSALKYKEQDWMINLPLYAVRQRPEPVGLEIGASGLVQCSRHSRPCPFSLGRMARKKEIKARFK